MIFWSYSFATGAIILLSLFPRLDLLGVYGGSLRDGYIFTVACYLSFLAAYSIGTPPQRGLARNGSSDAKRSAIATISREFPIVRNKYLLVLTICSLIGAAVSVLQVYTSLGFDRYLALLARGGEASVIARGATILVDSSEGGLPGYLKVWNVNCTLAVLVVINLLANGHKFRGFTSRLLLGVILLCFVVRNFIYMDRLALLALVPATIQLWQVGSREARRALIFSFALIGVLAQVQSMRRGYNFGAFTFFVLYVQSGMVNTTLMVNSLVGPHTYGFASILSPIYWLAKAAGSKALDVTATARFSWIWNSAQNAYGTLFLDFGWFALLVLAGFGILARHLDNPSQKSGRPDLRKVAVRRRVRAVVSYAALSTMFVPAYQGLEYWVLLGGVIAATWMEHRHSPWCFNPARRSGNASHTAEYRLPGLAPAIH